MPVLNLFEDKIQHAEKIEENLIIKIIWFCFRPLKVEMIIEIKNVNLVKRLLKSISKKKGIIFWVTERKKKIKLLTLVLITINHIWKGAKPIFRISLNCKTQSIRLILWKIKKEKNNIEEAIAWGKK